MRFFNTAGPMKPEDHYCLPPLERWDLPEVLGLIAQKRYFVLHAPRQTGKTSCLLALRDHLNAAGGRRCAYINVEAAQGSREDVRAAMQAILGEFLAALEEQLGDASLRPGQREFLDLDGPQGALRAALTAWANASSVPTVLLLDEIDSLVGEDRKSVV